MYSNPGDSMIFPQNEGPPSRFLQEAFLIWKTFIGIYFRYFINNIGTPNSHIAVVAGVADGTLTNFLKVTVKAQCHSQTAAMAGTDFHSQNPQVVCDLSKG